MLNKEPVEGKRQQKGKGAKNNTLGGITLQIPMFLMFGGKVVKNFSCNLTRSIYLFNRHVRIEWAFISAVDQYGLINYSLNS